MLTSAHGELQVMVPVGLLLSEPREVSVYVERPGEEPLPVRLRLIPAVTRRPEAETLASVSTPTPLSINWPARTLVSERSDAFPLPDVGGGD